MTYTHSPPFHFVVPILLLVFVHMPCVAAHPISLAAIQQRVYRLARVEERSDVLMLDSLFLFLLSMHLNDDLSIYSDY
jgi:hypothetical protein